MPNLSFVRGTSQTQGLAGCVMQSHSYLEYDSPHNRPKKHPFHCVSEPALLGFPGCTPFSPSLGGCPHGNCAGDPVGDERDEEGG